MDMLACSATFVYSTLSQEDFLLYSKYFWQARIKKEEHNEQ